VLAHFDRLADAPDAVPRLRRFVLDLAVRGKLVPQDPDDEPAAKTVARILRERKLPVGPGPDGDERPFEVPWSWAWASVAQVSESRLGKMLDKGKNKGRPRRYLRNLNVRWFGFDCPTFSK
jgi:type I restriction enzyme S subunit